MCFLTMIHCHSHEIVGINFFWNVAKSAFYTKWEKLHYHFWPFIFLDILKLAPLMLCLNIYLLLCTGIIYLFIYLLTHIFYDSGLYFLIGLQLYFYNYDYTYYAIILMFVDLFPFCELLFLFVFW